MAWCELPSGGASLFNACVLLLCFLVALVCILLSLLSPPFLEESVDLLTCSGFWQLSSSVPKAGSLLGFKASLNAGVEAPAHLWVTEESPVGISQASPVSSAALSDLLLLQPPWLWYSHFPMSHLCFLWSFLFFTMGALWKQLDCWMSAGVSCLWMTS